VDGAGADAVALGADANGDRSGRSAECGQIGPAGCGMRWL